MYERHFPVGREQKLDDPATKTARYIAMRSYTNIGNTMRIAGDDERAESGEIHLEVLMNERENLRI